MSSKYDVSIIIVNYNGKKYIDGLFNSLEKLICDDFSFEVIFVDNNSSDDSIAYLETSRFSKMLHLNIIKSEKNLGFAGGNNLGVKHSSGNYIVFLNNDTAVDKNWLSNLYHYFISHNYGIVNSKLLFFYDFLKLTFRTQDKIIFDRNIKINGRDYIIDNKFCKNLLCNPHDITVFGHSEISIPLIFSDKTESIEFSCNTFSKESDFFNCCGKELCVQDDGNLVITVSKTEIGEFSYSLIQNAGSFINQNYDGGDLGFCELDSEKYNQCYEIDTACGAAMILRKEDFLKVGGFDERFFMYYEDTDLSFRIKKLGKKLAYCPTSLVRHIHTGSSTEWSPFFIYHVVRNKILFVWKNISKMKALYYIIRQYAGGIKHKDKMKRLAASDAFKIISGKRNVVYKGEK